MRLEADVRVTVFKIGQQRLECSNDWNAHSLAGEQFLGRGLVINLVHLDWVVIYPGHENIVDG